MGEVSAPEWVLRVFDTAGRKEDFRAEGYEVSEGYLYVRSEDGESLGVFAPGCWSSARWLRLEEPAS